MISFRAYDAAKDSCLSTALMKVVSDFHPPSSVSCSVKCTLTDGLEHLVVAKTNRVEVYSLRPEGLHSECELEIWGRIIALRNIPKDVSTFLRPSRELS